jgi:hypothetical protein
MQRGTRFKVLWAVWMSGGGIATTVIVYVVTGSLSWALLGLVASGILLIVIAQVVIQAGQGGEGDSPPASGWVRST